MKGMLVYANKSGHAKETARTLAKRLDLPVASVDEAPDLTNVDCLCLIGELKNGEAMPQMVTYVSKLKTKEFSFFCTKITIISNMNGQLL